MSSKQHTKKPVNTFVRKAVSNLPGVPDGQVIASSPNVIKENSSVRSVIKKK